MLQYWCGVAQSYSKLRGIMVNGCNAHSLIILHAQEVSFYGGVGAHMGQNKLAPGQKRQIQNLMMRKIID
jgi:hypothetical protein